MRYGKPKTPCWMTCTSSIPKVSPPFRESVPARLAGLQLRRRTGDTDTEAKRDSSRFKVSSTDLHRAVQSVEPHSLASTHQAAIGDKNEAGISPPAHSGGF